MFWERGRLRPHSLGTTLPTKTSWRPGTNQRPCRKRISGRIESPSGVMPYSAAKAGAPSLRLSTGIAKRVSAAASGSAVRRIAGAVEV